MLYTHTHTWMVGERTVAGACVWLFQSVSLYVLQLCMSVFGTDERVRWFWGGAVLLYRCCCCGCFDDDDTTTTTATTTMNQLWGYYPPWCILHGARAEYATTETSAATQVNCECGVCVCYCFVVASSVSARCGAAGFLLLETTTNWWNERRRRQETTAMTKWLRWYNHIVQRQRYKIQLQRRRTDF